VIQQILLQLLYSAPYFIVWLVGIILAVVRWQRHPRLSTLVFLTFLLFMVVQVIITVIEMMLPRFAFDNHMSFTTITLIEEALDLILFIPLWGLLLWAIFGWRKPATVAGPVPLTQPQWIPGQPQPFQPWPQPPPQPGQPQFQAQPLRQPLQSPPDSASPQNPV